eukprot:TRINITY_DN9566_c0_g1_i1.p1 TRINITY_DN9566_c0_g1~~TRINITY_DN9566_c0_g1_i1.p1  ORF type:complete len:356 (+),score=45.09 TRINITY_DN9566_c0_g1_i1:39-1070(+)
MESQSLISGNVSLSGKTAIVTGSNVGLGRETALALAAQGATVVMACRNIDRAMEAAAYIRQVEPAALVEPMVLDLQSPKSITSFVSSFKASHKKLHILVNNAGASFGGKSSNLLETGVALCTQVNFLGPYMLTRLLKDELVAAAPSRVVNVSSCLHRVGRITDVEKYMRTGGYPDSKLANVLFTNEIQRRWKGKGVQSAAVDPGVVYTAIWRNSPISRPPISWFFQSVFAPSSDGAVSIIHAATQPWHLKQTPDTCGPFFARGLYATPLITTFGRRDQRIASPLAVLSSFIDWPVRRLSGGWLWSKVYSVPTNPIAQDSATCQALWEAAQKASGLPEDTNQNT